MSVVAASREYEAGPTAQARVLIADDHPLILAGIRRTLERSGDIEIVGEATSGQQVLAMVDRRRPEVVLLDLHMPGVTGPDLILAIHQDWPSVKIVVLSANDDRAAIDGALNAGASAYILKSVNTIDLPSVVRQVAAGATFLSPARSAGADAAAAADRHAELTERERTILTAISSGQTTSAISRELWVSEHTIKFHLTNIYRKLGVSNRAGAIRFAIEHGLGG